MLKFKKFMLVFSFSILFVIFVFLSLSYLSTNTSKSSISSPTSNKYTKYNRSSTYTSLSWSTPNFPSWNLLSPPSSTSYPDYFLKASSAIYDLDYNKCNTIFNNSWNIINCYIDIYNHKKNLLILSSWDCNILKKHNLSKLYSSCLNYLNLQKIISKKNINLCKHLIENPSSSKDPSSSLSPPINHISSNYNLYLTCIHSILNSISDKLSPFYCISSNDTTVKNICLDYIIKLKKVNNLNFCNNFFKNHPFKYQQCIISFIQNMASKNTFVCDKLKNNKNNIPPYLLKSCPLIFAVEYWITHKTTSKCEILDNFDDKINCEKQIVSHLIKSEWTNACDKYSFKLLKLQCKHNFYNLNNVPNVNF